MLPVSTAEEIIESSSNLWAAILLAPSLPRGKRFLKRCFCLNHAGVTRDSKTGQQCPRTILYSTSPGPGQRCRSTFRKAHHQTERSDGGHDRVPCFDVCCMLYVTSPIATHCYRRWDIVALSRCTAIMLAASHFIRPSHTVRIYIYIYIYIYEYIYIYTVFQVIHQLISIAWSILNVFSKFFHSYTLRKISYKTFTKNPITP